MSQHSSKGASWEKLREAVLKRDGYLCQICHQAQATTADHIIPKAKGGEDSMENLQAACRPCNGKKRDTLLTRTNYRSSRWF